MNTDQIVKEASPEEQVKMLKDDLESTLEKLEASERKRRGLEGELKQAGKEFRHTADLLAEIKKAVKIVFNRAESLAVQEGEPGAPNLRDTCLFIVGRLEPFTKR